MMKQITDGVYWLGFYGGFLNVFLVERGGEWTVIDTGIGTQTVAGIQSALEKHGHALDQIRHILITHAHPDHIGGLADLQGRTQAKTYMHPADALIARGERASSLADPATLKGMNRLAYGTMRPYRVKTPAVVDVEVREGDVLDDVLPGLRVVELPGHSYGQVGYYWPARKVLFGGDVMMHFPWGLAMPLRMVSPDWDAAKASIRKVSQMDIDILCVGHGPVIRQGAQAKVRAYLSLQ